MRAALARDRHHEWALLIVTVLAVMIGGAAAARYGWLSVLLAGGLLLVLKRDLAARRKIERRLLTLSGDRSQSLDEAIQSISARFVSLEHRLAALHPVSRLPMRERLFEVIEQDINAGAEGSCLGLFRIANFDRIAGLSPILFT